MMRYKFLIPFIIFALLIIFFWQGLHRGDPRKLNSVLIGKSIPEFNSQNLLADTSISKQDFLGHLTLLNVWASWCLSCHNEHVVLMDMASTNKIAIYGLNYKDDLMQAKTWLRKYGNPYQKIIADNQGKLAIDFGVYGTPETFLIDEKGIIQYKFIGPLTAEVWQKEIMPLILKLSQNAA